jgi:hypothetical protein
MATPDPEQVLQTPSTQSWQLGNMDECVCLATAAAASTTAAAAAAALVFDEGLGWRRLADHKRS